MDSPIMTIVLKVCSPANDHPECAPRTVVVTLETEPKSPEELRIILDYWMNATASFYPGARVEYRTDEQEKNAVCLLQPVAFDQEKDRGKRAQEERAGKKVTRIRSR
jgi:hypothetical protein